MRLFKTLMISALMTGTIATASQAQSNQIDYSVSNAIVERLTVEAGDRPQVAYDFVRRSALGTLQGYENYLAKQDISALSQADQLAYWLNLQNLVVIKAIAEDTNSSKLDKEVGTATARGRLWTQPRVTVAGRNLSISDIEANALALTNDPNVIYGLYQGVKGAPELSSEAFDGSRIDQQLAALGQDYVNSKKIVSAKKGKLKLSSYYSWYQDSVFQNDQTALIAHIQSHAGSKLSGKINPGQTISFAKLNYRVDNYIVPNEGVYSSSGTVGGQQRTYGS